MKHLLLRNRPGLSLPARMLLCAVIALGSLPATTTTPLFAASTITYVQSNYADPQTPQTTVAVKYKSAQTAGNLNLIVVGWNDSTATVATVSDSSHNTYTAAVGPTVLSGYGSQTIYYAKNIAAAAANANTVTVTYSTPAAFPDIRIVEYSGADTSNPIDVVAGATGSGGSASSGAATTTNATDLIFGANTNETASGLGSGFTQRIFTSPDADIVEDKMVSATGSNAATAPISPNGRWVMQMVAVRTPPTSPPPTAPTNLTATPSQPASGSPINLSWTASTSSLGIATYLVERCAGTNCSNFVQIATPTTTAYSDTTGTVGSYSYRVRAKDTAGALSSYSNVATSVLPDTVPPSTPTNLKATVAGSAINLSWTASTDNVGVTGYLVERCAGASCSNFAQIATPTTTTYSDTGLTTGSYSYRVRATDAAANLSGYSAVASGTIADTIPPSAPSGLTATLNTSTVNLSWTASVDTIDGVASYFVERCQGASCSSFAQIATPAGTVTTYSDQNLTPATYSYRVRASDNSGNLSGYSNVATITVADVTPPTAPSGLTATGNGTTINVTWISSTDNVGVSSYLVERCSGAGCTNFAQINTSTGPSYADSNLALGSYSYRVRATDAAGNLSAYSNTGSASATSGPSTFLAGYPFSEGTGTTTADVSGNNLTGTLQGATWTTSGKFGNALSFNGSSSFVDLGTPAPLLTTGSMTWEAWVFPTANPSDDGQIISYSNGSAGWQLKTTPDTGPRTFGVGVWGAGATARTQRYSSTTITNNTWYHVAGVYNATAQTLDIYVNGVLNDGTLRNAVPSSQLLPSGVSVNIGRRGSGFYFIGTIDEVRVYGRPLSAAEIQNDMNTPVGQPADTVPPTAPTNLVATASSGSQIDLSWTAATDNVGVSKYFVQRCQNANCTTFAQVASTKFTTLIDTGLTPNTSYSYQVNATDAAGNLGPFSNVASATTQPPTPPTAPGNLTATAASVSQINLSWGPSSASLGVANYSVERCAGASCTNFAVVGTPTTNSFNDTGLQANTSYRYQVRAFDTAGTPGPYSNVASATTPSPSPPTAPSNLTAAGTSSTQVTLNWTASTSSVGLANYVVQRCQGASCSNFATIASPVAPATTYSDTGLTTGTNYSYRVQAVDTLNQTSPFSNIANATPQSGPTGLIASYGLNDGLGAAATDSSGNGINGNVVGATWTTSGKYGGALNFSGTSSFVDLGSPVSLSPSGSMSWEAWIFPTSWPIDDGNVISHSDATGGWQFKTTPDTGPRTLGVAVSGALNSHTQRYSKTVLALNTWYHIAGVYNAAAQTLDVYVNGVQDDGTLIGSVPASQVVPNVNNFIGQRSDGYSFIGTIDEVRIYGRALSAAEIQSDMNTALPSAIATVNPTSLNFGNQSVNTTSAAKPVTLTNTGTSALTIGGISFAGAAGGSYAQTNNCPASLAPNASCTIDVTFAPLAGGTQAATMTIADNASNSHVVSVTGVGVGAPFTVSPKAAALTPILTQQFTATSSTATWAVDGVTGGAPATGTITAAGLYTPPSTAGQHTITATDSTGSVSSTVYISTYAGTVTRDVTKDREGLNANETVLTPANVNQARFGKLYNYPIDGTSDASPLYVANVNIPGKGAHNVVFVATEHDSVYAFDADNSQTTPLWQDSFINPAAGITTVPPNDTGECCDISPEIGITGSPVIDPATNTLYVVVKTKEGGNYFHRLHALDLATGAEKLGGPVVISASKPGNGAGSINGQITFLSLHENQRAALLLNSGNVYIAFAGHGDNSPYHGWILGYNATTLQQTMSFLTSPNDNGVRVTGGGQGSGVWQSGDGLATDASGDIYFVTGNGIFDVNTGGSDYGDTVMRITKSGTVVDYFTPHDQQNMNDFDLDLGSGGVMLLPPQAGAHPNLLLTAGKNGSIYLINRDSMGKYNTSTDNVVQVIPNEFPNGTKSTGNFKAPVLWNGKLFYSADADFIKSFALTNGVVSTTPTSQSTFVPQYPGATLGLSANGNTNGILWAIQRVDTDPTGQGQVGPGILHAFDANSLSTELWNSTQNNSRDGLDRVAKWSAPLVANGKVFISSLGHLTVYGELP